MCAPSDVWSLGIVLINLTCGSNPWQTAGMQDPDYQDYGRSKDFLKSILPISDGLDDILRCVLEPNPKLRVTISELRNLVMDCPNFAALKRR